MRELYKEFGLREEDELTAILVVFLGILLASLLLFQRSCGTDVLQADLDVAGQISPSADLPLVADGFTGGDVVFTGDAEPNQELDVLIDGRTVGTTEVDGDGEWTYTADVDEVGSHTLQLLDPLDDGGELDSPMYPFMIGAAAAAGLAVNEFDFEQIEGEERGVLTLDGTSSPYCDVEIFVDDTKIGTTQADASGDWSFSSTVAKRMGNHNSSAVCNEDGVRSASAKLPFAIGAAGLAGAAAEQVAQAAEPTDEPTVEPTEEPTSEPTDTPEPTALPTDTPVPTPTLVEPTEPAPAVVIAPLVAALDSVDSSDVSDDGEVIVDGSAEPNAEVTVTLEDGTELATTADADGNWAVTFDGLEPGDYDVTIVTDIDGDEQEAELDFAIAEPTPLPIAPLAAALDSVDDAIVSDDGEVIVNGTAEPGADVTITLDDGTELETTADDDGNWSVTFDGLEPGDYGVDVVTNLDGDDQAAELEFKVADAPEPEPTDVPEDSTIAVVLAPPSEDDEVGTRLSGLPVTQMILDASWSMTFPLDSSEQADRLTADDPDSRIYIARESLVSIVNDVIPAGAPVGLRAFGNKEGDFACRTDSMAAPGELDAGALSDLIQSINPQYNANTALAESLKEAGADLAEFADQDKLIVLLTDGKETCEGDPVAAINGLVDAGIDVDVNIVGFAIDDDEYRGQLEEMAVLGGGEYFDARDIDQLNDALSNALGVPYDVIDGDGNVVASGTVNGSPLVVDPGTYSINILTSPVTVIEGIEVGESDTVEVSP